MLIISTLKTRDKSSMNCKGVNLILNSRQLLSIQKRASCRFASYSSLACCSRGRKKNHWLNSSFLLLHLLQKQKSLADRNNPPLIYSYGYMK